MRRIYVLVEEIFRYASLKGKGNKLDGLKALDSELYIKNREG